MARDAVNPFTSISAPSAQLKHTNQQAATKGNSSALSALSGPGLDLKHQRDEFEEERASFHAEMKQEKRLLKKQKTEVEEKLCRVENKSKRIDARAKKLERLEEELSTLQEELYSIEAEKALKQLEDTYACAMCFDVLAYPHGLSPAQCGHTFCGLCILKWCLSNFCTSCNVWHARLECPLCRAQLPAIVMHNPNRSENSCPFTINRQAESSINTILESLDEIPNAKFSRMKLDVKDAVLKWRIGGSSRLDLVQRVSTGRREMLEVISQWKTLNSTEFKNIKARLGV